ncbi:MAG TPA: uroporphyrinogen decarboxylase family protein [Phycisphaerae bacterium]|nr:uroporphyrinogen decarboxylase family protein [Phycisphaerae bacterium]
MQTPREVIDALLRKQPAERVGLTDSPWEDTLKKWIDEGYHTDGDGKPVPPAQHFGFDMWCVGGGFDWHPKRGVEEIVEETDEWKVVRNGSGALLRWWKNRSGTPEHIDFAMTSRQVWEKEYRPHLLEVDRERVGVKATADELAKRREQGFWTHYGHQFIWENMRQSMGDYTMYTSLLTDPDWVHDYNRVYTDFYKTYFRILIEEAGKPDGVWLYEDLGYKGSLFCGPKVLEELIFPYYEEMVDFFHGYDLPVVLHTCGFTEPALDLIVGAGFDGLNPMEVKAGNDPLRIADRYADRLAFIGGLDARVLESGDRDLIRREVTRLVEGMKQRGARYVYASDHSVSTNVRLADFQFAIDVYREYMMY